VLQRSSRWCPVLRGQDRTYAFWAAESNLRARSGRASQLAAERGPTRSERALPAGGRPCHRLAGPVKNKKGPEMTRRANHCLVDPPCEVLSGGVLLSHTVSRAVPSALRGLASGFGMLPGVSLSLWPPKLYGDISVVGTCGRCRTRFPTVSREPHSGRVCSKSSSLWSSPRPISTGQLHVLPRFHFLPINPVV
jgi:hypothetical protein